MVILSLSCFHQKVWFDCVFFQWRFHFFMKTHFSILSCLALILWGFWLSQLVSISCVYFVCLFLMLVLSSDATLVIWCYSCHLMLLLSSDATLVVWCYSCRLRLLLSPSSTQAASSYWCAEQCHRPRQVHLICFCPLIYWVLKDLVLTLCRLLPFTLAT